MDSEIKIILFILFLVIGIKGFIKIYNYLLLRKLKDLPEIDRKYNEGLYSPFELLRAEYVIGFYERLGLYTSKYDEDGELIEN
jgi:hypothetical protein